MEEETKIHICTDEALTCTVSPYFDWCKKPESLSAIKFQPLNYRLPVRFLDTDGALKCVLKKRKEMSQL